MSITGPGCPACDFRGYMTHEGSRLASHPCGACSPWSHGSTFPDAAIRAQAAGILTDPSAEPRMTEWAERLMAHAAEVDADAAHAAARHCPPLPARCAP